jgi:hypothetical protein
VFLTPAFAKPFPLLRNPFGVAEQRPHRYAVSRTPPPKGLRATDRLAKFQKIFLLRKDFLKLRQAARSLCLTVRKHCKLKLK